MFMKSILTVLFLVMAALQLTAQDKVQYYEEVDVAPEIKGGMKALAEQITYPEEARKAGVEGIVIVEVRVSSKGHVDKVRAVKSDSELLTASALEAVRNISFKPGIKGGKAVATIIMVPVKYRLK